MKAEKERILAVMYSGFHEEEPNLIRPILLTQVGKHFFLFFPIANPDFWAKRAMETQVEGAEHVNFFM